MPLPELLYSVRMRAAAGGAHERGGRHLSGAERLVSREEVEAASAALLARALAAGAPADFIRLTVEAVPAATVCRVPALPVTTLAYAGCVDSRVAAERLLARLGISTAAIDAAFRGLTEGWTSSGLPLRGAALLDADTGARLDPDPDRGVRATRMDYAPGARAELQAALETAGLPHFRTFEALAVATKVITAGALAELCWSDDPAYTAGYVAGQEVGYVRFRQFKPVGAVGGRAFFVRPGASVPELIERLERAPVWITPPFVVE